MPSSSKDCSGCLQDAAKQVHQLCPNHTDARIWYDCCFLRNLGALMNKIRSEAVLAENEGLGIGKSELSTFATLVLWYNAQGTWPQ
ncbi:hypothetical protein Peur_012037 [Populus x canadensis]